MSVMPIKSMKSALIDALCQQSHDREIIVRCVELAQLWERVNLWTPRGGDSLEEARAIEKIFEDFGAVEDAFVLAVDEYQASSDRCAFVKLITETIEKLRATRIAGDPHRG